MANLRKLVVDEINAIGVKEASKLFGVSLGTVSNWAAGKTTPSLEAAEIVMAKNGPAPSEPCQFKEELVMWEGRKVMILLPCYRSFNPRTHFTLFANYAKYGPEKLAMEIKTRTVIHESRNILVDKAIKNPSVETVVMVDDDMIVPCGNAALLNGRYKANLPPEIAGVTGLSRLLSHGSDKGIVGSLYFGRTEKGHAQVASAFGSPVENEKFHNLEYKGLKKEDWVATGFLKIERWVLEKMKAEIDNGRWPECKPSSDDRWYGYFSPQKVGVGEDVSFGRRATEIGIQSYVDASLVCGHADGNYIYWHWNTKGK